MNGRGIVNDDALEEGFADVHEAFVLGALGLVEVVVLDVLEVEDEGVAEGVVGDRALVGGGGFADEAVLEVINGFEGDELVLKGFDLLGAEVLFQPEIDVVNHGGSMMARRGRGRQSARDFIHR